jgi:hypothetical protein
MSKTGRKGKKAGGRDFLPGQSGNPRGRPKLRDDLRKVKVMTADEASRLIQKMMDRSLDELQQVVDDPDTPAMELMVAKVIHKALLEGDAARLGFLMDRTIGKVVEKREVAIQPVIYRTGIRGDGTLIQEVIDEENAEVKEGEDLVEVEYVDADKQ